MAYIFYNNDRKSKQGMAANDDDKTAITSHWPAGTFVTENISDEDFNKLRIGSHEMDCSGDNPVLVEVGLGFGSKEDLDQHITYMLETIQNYLNNWKDHAHYSRWSDYKTQLLSLDTSSITYPMEKSLEKHFSDQGQPYYSVLELP